jgi:NarL family two-component system sensor histidine kinase LiaS
MAERLQGLLQSQQELATLEERNRLARDLHDTVKQHIFATQMQCAPPVTCWKKTPRPPAGTWKRPRLIRSAQQELGHTISELRPAALDGKGLAEAVTNTCKTGRSARTSRPSYSYRTSAAAPDSEQPCFDPPGGAS